MDFNTFKQQALVTESHPDTFKCNPDLVMAAMSLVSSTGAFLDMVKKAAFYGKPIDQEKAGKALFDTFAVITVLAESPEVLTDPHFELPIAVNEEYKMAGESMRKAAERLPVRLTHAFIGGVTEDVELIDALLKAVLNEVDIDRVNVGEEYGDHDWYKALAFDELGLDEPATREAVIAKLRKRYPDKFSAQAAIERDVDAEREILNDKLM